MNEHRDRMDEFEERASRERRPWGRGPDRPSREYGDEQYGRSWTDRPETERFPDDRGRYRGWREEAWRSEPWRDDYRSADRHGAGSRGIGAGQNRPYYPREAGFGETMPDGYRDGTIGDEARRWSNPDPNNQFGTGGYRGQTREYRGSFSPQGESRNRYAGKGPRGYRRSDERIQEDANEALTQHPGIDATEITVQVRNGEITLTGTVEDRRAKRDAEDAVEMISGVKEVHNQLRVGEGSLGTDRESRSEGSSQPDRGRSKSTSSPT